MDPVEIDWVFLLLHGPCAVITYWVGRMSLDEICHFAGDGFCLFEWCVTDIEAV